MKQETKELIEWIKAQIFVASKLDCSYHITADAEKKHKETETKAFNFLDSLEEIEKRLCLGGYIQDRNGTPCCNGDRILHNGNRTGTLRYTKEDEIDIFPHWWFDLDDKDTAIPQFEWFEKIEK